MIKIEEKNIEVMKKEDCFQKNLINEEELKGQLQKQQMIFDQQQRNIKVGITVLYILFSCLFMYLTCTYMYYKFCRN